MKQGLKRSVEQVVLKLRQIEIQRAEGESLTIACREAETSEQSDPRWREEYGGLQIGQDHRVKDLGGENARLRRIVAGLSLLGQVLADVDPGNL